jgi:hypothetical protein
MIRAAKLSDEIQVARDFVTVETLKSLRHFSLSAV